jgi:hypothetical protein
MYTGKIVEEAPVNELFARPRHPHRGLLRSVPKLTVEHVARRNVWKRSKGWFPIPPISRRVSLLRPAANIAPRCEEGEIPLYDLEGDVKVRCVLFDLAAAVGRSPRHKIELGRRIAIIFPFSFGIEWRVRGSRGYFVIRVNSWLVLDRPQNNHELTPIRTNQRITQLPTNKNEK